MECSVVKLYQTIHPSEFDSFKHGLASLLWTQFEHHKSAHQRESGYISNLILPPLGRVSPCSRTYQTVQQSEFDPFEFDFAPYGHSLLKYQTVQLRRSG